MVAPCVSWRIRMQGSTWTSEHTEANKSAGSYQFHYHHLDELATALHSLCMAHFHAKASRQEQASNYGLSFKTT